ncbi:MAG: hypothetical protein K2P31_03200 [Rickettsiaceae bacterium]|nr:hypothetical protein [Rickettsiaceae bacterium]
MAYPLIILGAGASHDYSAFNTERKICPMTKNLVDSDFLDVDLLEKFPGSNEILVEIIDQVKTYERSFEEVLTTIKSNASETSDVHKNIVALEFYLQELFRKISNTSNQGDEVRKMCMLSNYKSLLNKIDTCSGKKACVISFNYDSLFEGAISGKEYTAMSNYINQDIKIIKLHGSHDWVYIGNKRQLGFRDDMGEDAFSWALRNPKIYESFKENYQPYHQHEVSGPAEQVTFPALAIPLTGKDKPLCPGFHFEKMCEELPKVDRVLIVGWKAADPFLLENLKLMLTKYIPISIVSNTKEGADVIAKTVSDALGWPVESVVGIGGGFSKFLNHSICGDFFKPE